MIKRGTAINSGVPNVQVSTEKEITFEWENGTSMPNKIKKFHPLLPYGFCEKKVNCLVFLQILH